MAIITKPAGGIVKGVSASISLSKSELSALPLIVADSYFSNTSNWNKVILKYRSSTGKQYETVQFDATLSSPTGNFLVSIKARNAFEIQTIEIHDFDNDIFIVPRSALTTADFDIVLLTAPSSLSYSTPVTYTQNTAITNNVPTVTGTVTSYSILPVLPAGLNFNTTTGVISGTPTEASAAANYVVTASNGAGSTTATINITVESSIPENLVTFTGRNNSTYISFPAPGSVTRLLPAVNLAGNGQGSFWSTTPLTGDFTFTATVKAGSVSDGAVQALFGLNDVMPPPSNSGYGLKAAGWGLNFYNDGSSVKPWDVTSNTLSYTKGSTYNIEIKRVSGVVSYKVNSTTFSYTLSTSATVYIVGYLQVGAWEVTNARLVTPTSDYITWDLNVQTQTLNSEGGISGSGFTTPSVLSPSSALFSSKSVTADFKLTYKINLTTYSYSNSQYVQAGLSRTYTSEGNSGSAVAKYVTGIGISSGSKIGIFANGALIKEQNFINGVGPNNLFPSGISILEIEKIGSNYSISLNSNLIHTFQMPLGSFELFPIAEVQTGFEILEAYYDQDPVKTYSLSNVYKSSNLTVSNNNKTIEATALNPLGFGTAIVSPGFSGRNTLAKYYCEFTIDNKMPNSQMSFGLVILNETTTVLNTADLSGSGPIGTYLYTSIAHNIKYSNSRMLYRDGQGTGATFTINTGDVIGLYYEAFPNQQQSAYVKIFKNGSIVSTTTFGKDRIVNHFFAFSPHLVGDKITLKDTPDYVMPAGTTYIKPVVL